jgi:hypothetical protein
MMKEKNAWRSFHEYAIRAYAVNDEKYTAKTVTPTLTVIELMNPVIGLNALPVRIFQLLIKYFDGTKLIEDCWISYVERVAFMNMIQNGKMERRARKVQTT